MKYLVRWEIEFEAGDAADEIAAAKIAREIQLDPNSTATVFEVIDTESSKITSVDVALEEGSRSPLFVGMLDPVTEFIVTLLDSKPNWKLDGGRRLRLLTPEEFKNAPDGLTLYDINGGTHVKGKDPIDDDTRFGHLAYGVLA